MDQSARIDKERRRFYDGGRPGDADGSGAEPPDPNRDVLVILDRQLAADRAGRLRKEVFVLRRRIAYDDRHHGEIIVPPVFDEFTTELTSVPTLFSWLVPKTGAHLPAALLHDGLIWNPVTESQTYLSSRGEVIDRVEADRIFRDGMADTGTGLIRRWLVWTGVTLATMWSRQTTSASALGRAYYRWIMVGTLFAVAWLGYVATADLFDRTDDWWLAYELSWMGDRSFAAELATGLAGAIVVPSVLGLLWGRFRTAGWIAGIGVAVLFHLTVGLLLVSGLYAVLELLAARLRPAWLVVLAATVLAAAVAAFVLALAL